MIIKSINIKSFGPLIDKTIEPSEGLNVIEGNNESGKSTVAMFIKFMLYGLGGKAVGGDSISEKARYINWDTGIAQGSMTVFANGKDYRIDRTTALRRAIDGKEGYYESVKFLDLESGTEIKTAKSVGEYLTGLCEKVFMQSAFVKSVDKTKVDGSGLKVALENLASSGDEEINTKKALEKLDDARKLLRHKNGYGGKIAELSAEKGELEELLEKSRDVSKEIVDVEGTLADVKSKIASREHEEIELSALCRAYEAVRRGARVKEIESLEESVNYLEKELPALDPSIDRSLLAKIDLCEGAVRDTERDINILSEKKKELEEKCKERDTEEPEESDIALKKAKKLKNLSAFCLSVSCALLAFSIVGFALLILFGKTMKTASESTFIGLVILSAAFILFSGVGFFSFFAVDRKYVAYLGKYGVEKIEMLEEAANSKCEKFRYTKKLLDKSVQVDELLDKVITRHDEEIDNGISYAKKLGVSCDNVFEALSEAKELAEEICVRRETMSAKLQEAKGRLSALLEEVGEEEREKAGEEQAAALENLDCEKIFAMTKDQYNEAVRQKNFAESQIKALRIREAELEKRLAALRAAGASPAETASRISCIEARLSQLSFKHKALVLAYGALERAGDKMRNSIMPKVSKRAAAMMSGITEGKYDSLSSGDSLDLSVVINDEKKSVDALSDGTKDAAYVSLRAALVREMCPDNTPPLIFDECFARMDNSRLYGVFSAMSQEDFPQSFVFTCRPDEGECAPQANLIKMKDVVG